MIRTRKTPPIEYKSKVPPAPRDPWSDWAPQWTDKKKTALQNNARPTPHDMQERQSPTAPASTRQADGARRRLTDARLWGTMTFNQQRAASQIADAFEALGRGLGYATSNWQRIPGCKSAENAAEAHARMINAYTLWARDCAKNKISHAMVIDVLCYGFSCRMIDCDRRQRNGATRDNLMKGLTLYCRLQGWG